MSTKIDLITSCYSQLRISGITVQPTPQHLSSALFRLEDMMAELEDNYGVCVGYNFEEVPDANSESGVKRSVNQMIATNLATRLIPDFNKMAPQALTSQASQSISAIMGVVAADKLRQVMPSSRMPIGSGYRYRERYQRFNRPETQALNECATNKMVIGEINDYQESFIAYLNSENISSFTIASSQAINLVSSAISGLSVGIIDYRAQALKGLETHQHVIITIETDTGRREQRIIDFEIKIEDKTAASQQDVDGNDLLASSLFGNAPLGG